jgi:hypothetical protein
VNKGSYTGRCVDFSKYAASCFNPYLYTGYVRTLVGCGASALALLTGVPPEDIAAHKRGAHYSDAFMVRFLRRHGFHLLQLTQCNVSASRFRIGADHVLLVSQLYQRNIGTWIVMHGDQCYHNFDVYALDRFSFINKPLLSAYLVGHRRWQNHPDHSVTPIPKPKPQKGGITGDDLYRSRRPLQSCPSPTPS